MRRPWELGHMQQKPRGSPRVYLPFSLPDTRAVTFAVLELVGFSSSPASSQSSLSASLSSPQQPAPLCHSLLHPTQSFHGPHRASYTQPSAKIHSESSRTVNSPTRLQNFPVTAASPTVANTHGADADAASPPVAVFNGRVHVVQTHIKENVVHTTSSNFKEVVQQLTGASSILPSTVRPANKILDALSVKVDASKRFKKAPSKLQERWKHLRNLEKALSATSASPLLPSPVTPLASDFEFCTAITPTTSQSVSSPEASLIPESNSPIIEPYRASIAEHCTPGGGHGHAHAWSKLQQYVENLRGPVLLSLFPESPM